jgi:predicted PurR-regulated permease PerM
MILDINQLVIYSLILLSIISLCTFAVILPIAMQTSRTLSSAQNLLDTINNDLEPTVKEIKNSVHSVKSAFNQTNVAITSSTYGVLIGVKDYLASCRKEKNG